MNTQNKIDLLRQQLRDLEKAQAGCQHQFEEPFHTYDQKKEPIYENKPMGSDFFNPVLAGFKMIEISVWKRRCILCGFVQTTTRTEPIIQSHHPVF